MGAVRICPPYLHGATEFRLPIAALLNHVRPVGLRELKAIVAYIEVPAGILAQPGRTITLSSDVSDGACRQGRLPRARWRPGRRERRGRCPWRRGRLCGSIRRAGRRAVGLVQGDGALRRPEASRGGLGAKGMVGVSSRLLAARAVKSVAVEVAQAVWKRGEGASRARLARTCLRARQGYTYRGLSTAPSAGAVAEGLCIEG